MKKKLEELAEYLDKQENEHMEDYHNTKDRFAYGKAVGFAECFNKITEILKSN